MKGQFKWKTFTLIICAFTVSGSAYPTYLPDLEITKTANVSSVRPGDVFTYSLFVRNSSIHTASDVYIRDPLPNGLILQSWTRGENTASSIFIEYSGNDTWRPYCAFDPATGKPSSYNLIDHAFTELDITVQLDPMYRGDEIINTGYVYCIITETDFDNNASTLALPVVIPAPGAIVLVGIGASLVAWLRRRKMI